jgi:hypothetical protein
MPIACNVPSGLKLLVTPTTAFNFKSARVVAGLFRSTAPEIIPARTFSGNASTSTFNPIANAARGLTPGPKPPLAAPAMALSICSNPLQKSLSPKSSKRNISFPCATKDLFCSLRMVCSSALSCWSRFLEHCINTTIPVSAAITIVCLLYLIKNVV